MNKKRLFLCVIILIFLWLTGCDFFSDQINKVPTPISEKMTPASEDETPVPEVETPTPFPTQIAIEQIGYWELEQGPTKSINNIFICNNMLYAMAGNILKIYSIKMDGSLEFISFSSFNLLPMSLGIFATNNFVYLVNGQGLHIIDVSNPISPVLISVTAFDCPNFGIDFSLVIKIRDNLAYIGNDVGLFVFDISDPRTPHQLAYLHTGRIFELILHGEFAYVLNELGSRSHFEIIDISEPTQMHRVFQGFGGDSHYLCISGNYAYVSSIISGVEIYDITDPVNTIRTNYAYKLPGGYIQINDKTLYLKKEGYIYQYDISSYPTTPIFIKNFETKDGALWVEDDHFYVYRDTIDVIDASSANWKLINSYQMAGIVRDMYVVDDTVYIADEKAGIKILNILPSGVPILQSTFKTSHSTLKVIANHDFLYAVGSGFITKIDISDKTSPEQINTLKHDGTFKDIALNESQLYVATSNKISVFNVSKFNFDYISSVSINDSIKNIVIDTRFLYLSTTTGFSIYRIENPNSINLLGKVDGNFSMTRMTKYKNQIFAFNSRSNIQFIDVSDPSNPIEIASYKSSRDLDYRLNLGYKNNQVLAISIGDYGYIEVVDFPITTTPQFSGFMNTNIYESVCTFKNIDNRIYILYYDWLDIPLRIFEF